MNRRRQGVLVVLTVFMSCLLVAYLAVITTHHMHNGLALFGRHHESWHSGDNDSWSGSGTQEGSELYPTPTPVLDPTCQTLEQFAETSGICNTSDECAGLNCVVAGVGTFDFLIEPCHNPPAVHVVGRDTFGGLIVNETLTKSRQQSILGIGTLNINIQQSSNEDSISISVTVVLGGVPITVIPETTIPLNRAQCPHTVPPTQPPTTHVSTPLLMPSPTPRASETCESLKQFANSSQLCDTNDQCSGLHCKLPASSGSIDITVEPCHNPPALNVVQKDALGTVLYNQTITKSRQESFGFGTVNINVVQSPNEDSISLSVDVAFAAGQSIPVIPETRIPINREQCGFTRIVNTPTCSHTVTSALSQLSTTLPLPSSRLSMGMFYTVSTFTSTVTIVLPSKRPTANQSLTVIVAVPVTVILGLIGSVVLLIAIVLVIRRHRRTRREYHFQQMTFNTDNDDDDDDEDL